MGDLEALEAVTALSLATDDIQDLVDKLGALSVVTLGPVVACYVLLKLMQRGIRFLPAPLWPKTKLSGRKS